MANDTIMMRVFTGSSLVFLAKAYNEWMNFVNDDEYYSIIETQTISGNGEYMLIVRYKNA